MKASIKWLVVMAVAGIIAVWVDFEIKESNARSKQSALDWAVFHNLVSEDKKASQHVGIVSATSGFPTGQYGRVRQGTLVELKDGSFIGILS